MAFGKTVFAALVALIVWTNAAVAAPKAELWERWTAHDPGSQISVDHGAWDSFLRDYVRLDEDGITRLAYARVSNADRAVLDGYIAALSETPVGTLSRAEQMPFWVNLYNALTVKVILDHYPVESIRDIDISPGFFANGPWGRKLVTVEGEELSLDDIEHRVLRPIWRDPRIHYAVNCASIGCPNLQPMAMTAETAEDFLNDGARAFVNHPRGARIEDGKLYVSSIYDWFEEDFGDNDAGVIAHLKTFATGPLARALETVTRVSGDSYDWRLNNTGS